MTVLIVARGPSTGAFRYYIGPNGDDNNAGTLSSPWSLSALNNNASTYAGLSVGVIGDQGPYVYVQKGGTKTSIYSNYQLISGQGGAASTFNVNGGPVAGVPTYVASCNSQGAYVPWIADLCPTDPVTGSRPSAQGGFIGQSYNACPNKGNFTLDGLSIHGCFEYGIAVYPGPTGTYPYDPSVGGSGGYAGVTVQNCHVYDVAGNANNNMAGVHTDHGVFGAFIHNNVIHDIFPTTGNAGNCNGIGSFNIHGNTYQFNTIFNTPCCIHDKTQGTTAGNTGGGNVIQNNLLEVVNNANASAVIAGPGFGNSGEVYTVRNNVMWCQGCQFFADNTTTPAINPNGNVPIPGYNVVFYNNTVVLNYNGGPGFWLHGTTGSLTNYNNIVYNQQHEANGLIAILTPGSPGSGITYVAAYNLYGDSTSTPTMGITPYSSYTTYPSMSTVAAFASTTGQETGSVVGTPTFAGTLGQGLSTHYQLAGTYGNGGSSTGAAMGHVGGTSGGASVNVGAWDGIVQQIGSSLAAAAYPVILAPTYLPSGVHGTAYTSYQFTASGGTGTQTWSVSTPDGANGMSLSSGGLLSGTPTAAGTFRYVVSCTDAGLSQTQTYTTRMTVT